MPHNDLHLSSKYREKANNARVRGIEFNLSFTAFKNLMRAKRCFYSGVELTEPGAQSLMTDRSIDRIDADRPYESGNVVACCHKMNLLKSSFERVEHKVLVKMIKTITNSHSRRLSKS